MWRYVVQRPRKICDELYGGAERMRFVFVFVSLKPFSLVIAFQARQKAEEFGGEVRWHDKQCNSTWAKFCPRSLRVLGAFGCLFYR